MKILIIATVFLACPQFIKALDVFSLIGPKALRVGQPYRCTLNNHNFKGPIEVNVTLSGFSQDSGKVSQFSKIVKVATYESKTVEFSCEALPSGDYTISAVSTGSLKFSGNSDLTYVAKHFSIFVQTDKSIYKGDDIIRFRLFAIDSLSLPYSLDSSSIVTITDPADNIIKQFANVTFQKGRYENELQLSSSPAIGTWKISVKAEGDFEFSKTVEIQEYVLPAFFATLKAPVNVPYSDGKFSVTVGAEYTFGQQVEGKALVSFKLFGYNLIYERSLSIDSAAVTFDVDMKKDLAIAEVFYDQFLVIEVQFTDNLTGQLAFASAQLNILQFRNKILFDGASNFKPGMFYSYKLTAQKFDGSPAPADSKITSQIIVDGEASSSNQTFTLDNTGSVETQTFVSLNTTSLQINVFYEDAVSNNFVYPVNSYQNEYLAIDIITPKPEIYSAVEIKISSTASVPIVTIIMISKGIIVFSQNVKLNMGGNGKVSFIPNFSHAPRTDIIVFYVKKNGEIVTESSSIVFRNHFPNYVNLSLSNKTCKPGENITLSIASTLDSTISLLAIDQRVLLLKTGNDLSSDEIFDDFESYNLNYFGGDILIDRAMSPIRRPWFWYPTYEQKFEQVNLVIISNAINNFPFDRFPGPLPVFINAELSGDRRPVAPTVAASDPIKVRKDFSETFLWQSVDLTRNDRMRLNKRRRQKDINVKVPDSITSYLISAVSMNENFGLGLPTEYPQLTVFQPFFVQFTLPYSVKRGETLLQDIFVYSYLDLEQTVTVSISRNDVQFELKNLDVDKWKSDKKNYFQTVQVKPGTQARLTIRLMPKVIGFVTLKVTAIGSLAGDAVEQNLRVVSEGIASFNRSSIVFPLNNSISAQLSCILPTNVVADTIVVSASVSNDFLGLSLENLENLIQMPNGCGEQNMLNFVPNIVILIYLQSSGKLTASIKDKIISFTEQGYQREVQFFRRDGSFSAFGDSDPSGSTWLTAFVLKSFILAKPYITIDPKIVEESLNFIVSKQNQNGSFREDGRVIHSDMQGGSSSGTSLTAYVAIALTDCLSLFPQFQAQRDLALNYLVNNYNESDVYSLSVLSYALSIANHPDFSSVYAKLNNFAIDSTDGIHWEKTKASDPNSYWNFEPKSLDVEITAYALLATYNRDISRSLQIVRWLSRQQNSKGGFQSTQDTVVGLESLAKFSANFKVSSPNLTLTLAPDDGSAFEVTVNSSNALVLQSFDLKSTVRKLNISSKGDGVGFAIVSLSFSFYEITVTPEPTFRITHRFENPCLGYLKSLICLAYVKEEDVSLNMVLAKMTLPTGFIYDVNSANSTVVSKVETSNGGTEVDIYINSLTARDSCFYINAIQVAYAEELKMGTIEVFDYYDSTRKASLLYSIPKLSKCQPSIATNLELFRLK